MNDTLYKSPGALAAVNVSFVIIDRVARSCCSQSIGPVVVVDAAGCQYYNRHGRCVDTAAQRLSRLVRNAELRLKPVIWLTANIS